MNKERYNPTILTLSPEPVESMSSAFEKLGVKVSSLNLGRIRGLIHGKYNLKKFVSHCNPDIIQLHGFRAEMFAQNLVMNYPLVTVIRNDFEVDCKFSYGEIVGSLMTRCRRRYLKQISSQIVVSKSLLKENHDNLHFFHIFNGVDTDDYLPLPLSQRLELRQKLNLPAHDMIYIFTGRLVEGKAPMALIEGFLSSKAKENSILLIVGNGPLKEKCKKAAVSAHIRFTGRVQNVVPYLQASDLFISASRTEGMPNSVMEAMACGLGVCLSDIEPHREILELDANAGVMFNSKNSNSLSAVLDVLSSEKIKKMSVAAIQVAHNYLNAKIMSQKYQQTYEKILEVHR